MRRRWSLRTYMETKTCSGSKRFLYGMLTLWQRQFKVSWSTSLRKNGGMHYRMQEVWSDLYEELQMWHMSILGHNHTFLRASSQNNWPKWLMPRQANALKINREESKGAEEKLQHRSWDAFLMISEQRQVLETLFQNKKSSSISQAYFLGLYV